MSKAGGLRKERVGRLRVSRRRYGGGIAGPSRGSISGAWTIIDRAQCEWDSCARRFRPGHLMADRIIPPFMFLWPALAAASAREVASAIADEFAHLAVQQQPEAAAPLPPWATRNS